MRIPLSREDIHASVVIPPVDKTALKAEKRLNLKNQSNKNKNSKKKKKLKELKKEVEYKINPLDEGKPPEKESPMPPWLLEEMQKSSVLNSNGNSNSNQQVNNNNYGYQSHQ